MLAGWGNDLLTESGIERGWGDVVLIMSLISAQITRMMLRCLRIRQYIYLDIFIQIVSNGSNSDFVINLISRTSN